MIWILLIIVFAVLIFMERKGIIDTEELAVAVVFVLTGVAAYLGLK